MQYVTKFATEDKLTKCTQIRPDPYFDKRGVLKPGYTTQFEIGHIALIALMQWGQENAHAREELYKKHKLRFITNKTIFGYEVKTLVSMMHWDEFNKSFKFGCIMGHLKKKGTSFEKLREKAELMLREEERLSTAKFKRGMRYGRKFHAAVRIQEWWLRKKRKFRIYKNLYQLMDEYSVEGGFTGQDSRKYLGMGKGKNLLKIQEDIMEKIEKRRVKCRNFSKSLLNATCTAIARNRAKEKRRQDFFAKREAFNITHGLAPTIYGFGSSTRWADHDEPYYCEPCATTDLSYPGGGRSSSSLDHPRWAAQCSRCGKKNPYYEKTEYEMLELTLPSAPTHTNWREMSPSPPPAPPPSPCDEGPAGDKGPESSRGRWSGKWFRRFGLTK